MGRFRLLVGRRGETLAAGYLRKKGYRILCRNYRTRYGEIDLVARDGETVVFVEVKTRRSTACGLPEEAVNSYKARNWSRAALIYLSRHRLDGIPVRFDLVGINLSAGRPVITLHRDYLSSCP